MRSTTQRHPARLSCTAGPYAAVTTGVSFCFGSAGIGRSGTFIAIDMMLKQLRAAVLRGTDVTPALDVRAIVQQLRTDRPGMVQTAVGVIMTYPRLIVFA